MSPTSELDGVLTKNSNISAFLKNDWIRISGIEARTLYFYKYPS